MATAGTTTAAPGLPRQLIAQLGLDTRADADKQWTRQRAAEASTAARLRDFIAAQPGHPALTEADATGRTPLMEAAANGYADVVDALLADASVRARIDERDAFGASAWMLSQFSRPVTLISCHPQMYARERLPLLRPHAARIAYFLRGSTTSFELIAARLLKAGAHADLAGARAAWAAVCPGSDAALRDRLQASDNLPLTLWTDSVDRTEQFKRDMDATPPHPPTAALPRPVLPMLGKPDAWEQRWPRVHQTRPDQPLPPPDAPVILCTRMARPVVPQVNWSGHVVFRVVAEIQAGVPVVVDIRRTTPEIYRHAEGLLQYSLLGALAGYECAGDHVFEQEFQFKIK